MNSKHLQAPAGWALATLGEICDIDPDMLSSSTLSDYEFQYIDIASVSPNRISNQLSLEKFSTAPSRARKKVRKDDVLMATVRPNLKAIARIQETGELVASTGFAVLRARREVSHPEFLKQLLFSDSIDLQVESLVAGSNYPAITVGNVKRLKALVPTYLEQCGIADVLSALDEQIEATEALISKFDATRTGLIRDLLDEVAAAPKLPLKDLADIGSGITLGREFSGVGTAEYPYLRVANVQDGRLELSEVKTIRIPVENAEKVMLQPGDVLMNEGGDFDKLGRGAVWEGQIPNCLHQNHVFRVRCDQSKLLPGFLALWAASAFGKRFFMLASKQSTNLASINSTQLKGFPVLTPPIEKQRQILEAVESVDAIQAQNKAEIIKLRLKKQGLMKDLLTGAVRVMGAH